VRLCGYAPWGAQVMVNGHEWVERQARAHKVRVAKEGNCFIEGTHYRAVDRWASALSGPDLGPRLAALCARWLYSACLCFALPLTVWRVRWGAVVLKVYDQAGRVLRVEVKVLNTAGLGCGKGLGKLGEQLGCVQGMRERFLASLQAAHVAFLDAGQFERWAQPSQRGHRRWAGLDLNKARNRTVIAALSALATRPEGFTTADLAQAVRGRTGWDPAQYPSRRAAYDLARRDGTLFYA